jgi:hypothetical protein
VFQKTVVEARVVGDENAARDPRCNLAGDVGKPRCLGDHRIAYSGERLNGGRDTAIWIDQAAPFGGMAASTRTMLTSVTRSSLAVMPVVSRSTKARGSGNIEFQPIKGNINLA